VEKEVKRAKREGKEKRSENKEIPY